MTVVSRGPIWYIARWGPSLWGPNRRENAMVAKSAQQTQTCDAQRDGLRITFENPFDSGHSYDEILSAYRTGQRESWVCPDPAAYQVGKKNSCKTHVCIMLDEAARSGDWTGNQVAVTVLAA